MGSRHAYSKLSTDASNDPLLPQLDASPPDYRRPSSEISTATPAAEEGRPAQDGRLIVIYALSLRWPVSAEDMERQVLGTLQPSFEATLTSIRRAFIELREIENERIIISVPLDRATTDPLINCAHPSLRPAVAGVSAEAWYDVYASPPKSIKIDVLLTPEEKQQLAAWNNKLVVIGLASGAGILGFVLLVILIAKH